MEFGIGTLLLVNDEEYKVVGYLELFNMGDDIEIWEEYQLLSKDNKEYCLIYENEKYFFAQEDISLEYKYKDIKPKESYKVCVYTSKNTDKTMNERGYEEIYIDEFNENIIYSITKWKDRIECYKSTYINSIKRVADPPNMIDKAIVLFKKIKKPSILIKIIINKIKMLFLTNEKKIKNPSDCISFAVDKVLAWLVVVSIVNKKLIYLFLLFMMLIFPYKSDGNRSGSTYRRIGSGGISPGK